MPPSAGECLESESTRASATAQAEAEQIPSHTLSGFFSNFSKATDFEFLLRVLFAQRKKEDGNRPHSEMPGAVLPTHIASPSSVTTLGHGYYHRWQGHGRWN